MANIKKHLENSKGALFGKDVRSSIHDGIDAINKEVEGTTEKQNKLGEQFKNLVINEGNSNAEVAASRGSHDWLPDRLDNFDSQLEHNEYKLDILKKEKVNVFDFGVVGDGIADDSDAIQKAIDSLTDGGIVVFPPSYKYKITKQITVNSYVFLKGSEHMNERNIDKASVFYIYHGENEEDSCTFKMKISSGMSGFTFYYPNQDKEDALEPIPYAWTIDTTKEVAGNTDNVYLENLMLRNSYQGIKLVNAGRFYLNNIHQIHYQ